MKRIKPVLLFFIIFCQILQACKKSKSDPPPPAPIAAYPFDNDYIKNSVSNVLHGSYTGNIASTSDSFDVPFRAMSFNGDGFVWVADSDLIDFPGNQFTIAAWIRPAKASAAYIVIKNEEGLNHSPYSLDIHPGFLRAFVRTTTKEQFIVTGTTPIAKAVWQHVAVIFSGEHLTIYLNGKSEGSIAVDRPLAANKGNLTIGGKEPGFSSAFQGRIDNVKIYDKALTAGQISYLAKNYNL
jgi:hypothetical protein